MKSYNRPGDEGDCGDTGRFGGQRVRKTHPFVAANGDIDELCAHLGLCLAAATAQAGGGAEVLEQIQADLLAVGAMISGGAGDAPPPAAVGDEDVARLEREITRADEQLGPLRRLIVPGGAELACRLHVARCVCRRAERAMVAALDAHLAVAPIALRYLNRLGDLLFALARLANHAAGREERPWRP